MKQKFMQRTKKTRVKICCISSFYEARLAIQYSESVLGLVSAMPVGPGIITEDLIFQIAARIPPSVSSFLLASMQTAAPIMLKA
jgi:phosphoribosylanthranilate isomerase